MGGCGRGLIFNIQKFSLHDGDGIRTDVFFQGCRLRCKWCANPESWDMRPASSDSARFFTVSELLPELLKDKPFYDQSGGGVTLTGGEALLQTDFVCELCDALHDSGVNTAIETSAHVLSGDFDRALKKCDMLHIDLKHHDDAAHKRGTDFGNELILSNIRTALESRVRTVVRIPVIPGFNDSPEDMHAFAEILGRLGVLEAQLLPFHQLGESKYKKLKLEYAYKGVPQLHDEDLVPFAEILRSAVTYVQIGG